MSQTVLYVKKTGKLVHSKIMTGKIIQSSISEFSGMTQAVLLENSSKTMQLVKNRILQKKNWIGTHEILMDDFSSKMV